MDILEAESVLGGDDNLALNNLAAPSTTDNTTSVIHIDANGKTSVDRIGQRRNRNGQQNGVKDKIKNDPWFRKMNNENKMLERHIRFLKHIIEKEQQRCNFKEIIFGKKQEVDNNDQNEQDKEDKEQIKKEEIVEETKEENLDDIKDENVTEIKDEEINDLITNVNDDKDVDIESIEKEEEQ
mmetsp:Transcript_54928/g.49434  ORF Transcript_54928/g.49434 Transcript_54928/m.49434 type:complete len:182 (+) Transcript_54928:153-698(+)